MEENAIRAFLDRDGRLKSYPSKLSKRPPVLEWLAGHFTAGRSYTEREVGQVLREAASLDDPCFLRRELVDAGWLKRTPNGACYWKPTPQEGVAQRAAMR